MLNPQRAWQEIGLDFWYEHVPNLVKLEANKPGQATARAYRQGFKEAVGVANSNFCEMLRPDHRLN